jgi:hypothetical protein
MVVLPVPGGPQRIMEGILPFSMAVRRMLPLPARCSCPTSSSRVCGRIRSARGAEEFICQSKEEKWLGFNLLFTGSGADSNHATPS